MKYLEEFDTCINHLKFKVFVGTPGGGVDDHAVLLACYFHFMNIPCWIVQGNAIPDGPTTFIVTSFKVTFKHQSICYMVPFIAKNGIMSRKFHSISSIECWRGQRNSKEHEKHRIDLEPLHWRTLRRK